MQNIQLGLELLLQPLALGMLVFGVVLGFVVGVLPGFASSNAAAVLLPFTLIFSPAVALLFLSGIYAGASFASGVPAILLNVPGTGSAAATALDGYPMTQKGQAGLAIGIARTASAFGGFAATLAVLIALGPMAKAAIRFGSAEMFLVALVGLSVIGAVAGAVPVRGYVSCLLGLLIAAMAADRMMGMQRFTMGFPELYDEVPFVPAIVGLFALASMFELASKSRLVVSSSELRGRQSGTSSVLGEFFEGVRVTFSMPWQLIRATVIGTGVGIIPGAGTAVATFVAYGAAKRASKTPELFGNGAPEGVLAAECAENATTAGTLVPTFALGIPGSATAAVMLSALYINGILPGPQVLTRNAAEVYAVVLGLGVASLLILPLGVLLASPMTMVVRVQPRYLAPSVIVVCLIGAFAVRGFVFDVRLAIVFGLLGLLMRLTGYPVVPLILGMVLGPLAERNFVQGLMLGNGSLNYFFERPVARGLWVALALSVVFATLRQVKTRAKARRVTISAREAF